MNLPTDAAVTATSSASSVTDWLSFIAGIVSALAWPVAVILISMMFRGQISSLMPMIKKLKAGSVEAEFAGKVQELLAAPLTEINPGSTAPNDSSNRDDTAVSTSPSTIGIVEDHDKPQMLAAFRIAYELAKTLPRAAVITAWFEVDHAVIRLARRTSEANGQTVHSIAPAHEIMLINPQLGLVDVELEKRYQDLRIMRNKVMDTEDFNPTADAVVEYIHLVIDLVKKFDAIPGRKLPIFAYSSQGQFVPPERHP